jgi:hypothetical protein
LVLSAFTSSI